MSKAKSFQLAGTTGKLAVDEQVYNFLKSEGVERGWAHSAMGYIRLQLAGNRHFVMSLSKPKLRVSEFGYVASFQCEAVVNFPDANKVTTATLRYSFNPNKVNAHSSSLTVKGAK